MSPTRTEINEWFNFENQDLVMRAFYDLFTVEPTYRDDYVWVTEAIRDQQGELMLRHQRSWSVEATLAALDVLKNKGDNPRARNEEAIRFAHEVEEGNVVISQVLYRNMNKKRRKSPAPGY